MDEISSCWYISSIWAAYFSLTMCLFTWRMIFQPKSPINGNYWWSNILMYYPNKMHNFPLLIGFESRSCTDFCSSRTRLIIWRKKTLRVGVSSPPAMLKSVGKRRNFLTWAALLTTLEFVEFRLICTTSNDEASVSIFSQGKPLLREGFPKKSSCSFEFCPNTSTPSPILDNLYHFF